MSRVNLRPLSELADRADVIASHLESWAYGLDAQTFSELVDGGMNQLLRQSFGSVGADEGSIWLVDREDEFLIAAYNTGPEAASFIGQRQPLGSGIISLVFASEQVYCENEVSQSSRHDATIDQHLGAQTTAMIAVPLYFAGRLRGVVSCVQLGQSDRGFDPTDIDHIRLTVGLLERLIHEKLLCAAIGLNEG